jgi:hypothetical protein
VPGVSGNLLDGNGEGKPGGNYASISRGFGVDEPRVPFAGRIVLPRYCRDHRQCRGAIAG